MTEQSQSTFMGKVFNPILQALIVFSGLIIFMLVVKILKWSGSMDVNQSIFWVIAGTAVLFFALFNSVISLAVEDMNQYWTRSTLCYTILMISSGCLAYLFSSMTISEAGTFRWIFMVLTFGYLLFLSIMRFMRKIVQIAQKEDDRWMSRRK